MVTNKEPVCEMMSSKCFIECLAYINPNITTTQAEMYFKEALDLAHERVIRALESLWTMYIDEASHYIVQSVVVKQPVSSPDKNYRATSPVLGLLLLLYDI